MTKVLVVDNEGTARKTIVDILSAAHYEVTEASDGGAVVEKANSQRPDLILMDVDLPVMNGLDVLGRLREHPACRDTPVIMMASENNPAKGRLHAWGLGVKRYIIKPTQFDLVALAVKVTLREADDSLSATEASDVSTTVGGSPAN
jgi:CheY-like chemotaxis protein